MIPGDGNVPLVSSDQVLLFEDANHLLVALLAIGFVQAETAESIMRRLRRMLGRAVLADDDVKLLRGLARQTLCWTLVPAGAIRLDYASQPALALTRNPPPN